METGRQHEAVEESLLALTEQADAGEEVDLERCLELGETLCEKRGRRINCLSQMSGLVLSYDLVRRGRLKAGEELLHQMMDHEHLRSNTMFNVFINL